MTVIATSVKMVEHVTRQATTPDIIASVQRSGRETGVKQNLKAVLLNVFTRWAIPYIWT